MFKLSILLFIMFSFFGCSNLSLFSIQTSFNSNNEKIEVRQIPNWYLNPPQNSAEYLYGVGVGSKLESAKAEALNGIVANLSVDISSKFKKDEQLKNINGSETFSSSISHKIEMEVKKLTLIEPTIEKSEKIDRDYYIIMKVSRVKLLNHKMAELSNIDKKIDIAYEEAISKNSFEALQDFKLLKNDLELATSNSYIISILDPNFNSQSYINKYNSYLIKLEKIISNISFDVYGDGEFHRELINFLNIQGFKISKNSEIVVKLKSDKKESEMYGFYISKVTTTINFIVDDEVIFSKIIDSVGKSANSYSIAFGNASKEFGKKLKELDSGVFGF